MATAEASVQKVIAAYQQAVARKDVAALMQLYDTEVRVFDAWGVWLYDGAARWRVAVAGWFSSLGDEQATVFLDDVHIAVHDGFALVTGIATYAGFSAQGEPLRSMQNRLTWGIVLDAEGARIVHEHTSAPIGFDDMKGILQRSPNH